MVIRWLCTVEKGMANVFFGTLHCQITANICFYFMVLRRVRWGAELSTFCRVIHKNTPSYAHWSVKPYQIGCFCAIASLCAGWVFLGIVLVIEGVDEVTEHRQILVRCGCVIWCVSDVCCGSGL